MAKVVKKDIVRDVGLPTFADFRVMHMPDGNDREDGPRGAEIVEAIQPTYTQDGLGDWCYQGHMIQGTGPDYPALSMSDLRYRDLSIKPGKRYFDPLQGLPPRGIIREITDPSDDLNRIGGETEVPGDFGAKK